MFARKHFRKILTIVLACVMGIACVSALAACSQNQPLSDEDQIKAAIEKELDAVKSLDSEAIEDLANDEDTKASFDQIGLSVTDFLTEMFKGFDYKIDNVTVDGDKAEAEVTFTSKNLSSLGSLEKEITALIEDEVKKGNTDTESILKKVGPLMLEKIKGIEPSETKATLKFEKENDEWAATSENTEVLQKIFFEGLEKLFI